ncbi:MAG: TonB-dependent receptor [Bacteroidales bacterium]|nr:TonB-dependent receptor [Bacteroidales bacterium]MDD2322555.1 TonB-dependent receptor [Bacteroidales bacterium]MDD3009811.1 TonB-dependent receptor [Bacteroidales bacterium]MDD3961360.1 TonB-dependent receptor [Bacteroidales bacterium]MDY0285201.1 TonB-dependent receptor [Bacteroidales bacterium]
MQKQLTTLILLALWLVPGILAAQKYTISGYIEDAATSERLIAANVYDTKTYTGTSTNTYGFYSLTLPEGIYEIAFSFIGYETKRERINLTSNQHITVALQSNLEIEGVEIVGEKGGSNLERTQPGMVHVPMRQIQKLPMLLGEADVIKAIQLLPGVQSGSEGSSGLYVRGGGPDENLVLLDGVPVYNVNHLFGFFSVFNPDALKNVSLYKGGFPARFGGRLSSVLDISMKDGNMKSLHGDITVGLISSKITLEGPIIKNKTSFIISGRRTYYDLLAKPFISLANTINEEDISAGYYFYDLNVKINHTFNQRSRLYLSAYSGEDKLYVRSSDDYYWDGNHMESKFNIGMGWGNITTALRWNYTINPKLFSNVTATYSRYNFNVGFDEKYFNRTEDTKEEWIFDYDSGIYDWTAKFDFDWFPSPAHSVKFGTDYVYHTFVPGVNAYKITSDITIDTTFGARDIYANEIRAYAEDNFTLGKRFKANLGLHFSGFKVEKSFYTSLEPRLSLWYKINDKMSIKTAYTTMTQYILLLTTSRISLPTDLWLPVTDKIKPMHSKQLAAAVVYQLTHELEVSVEGFYKTMENVIEYKEGASFLSLQTDWQDKITVGNGIAYGGEFLVKKDVGKTTGWIGYTLSWSWREFEELNFGERFPAKYDRRHDIGIAITHKFNDHYDLGLVWVYGTGNAVTLGTQNYYSATIPNTWMWYQNQLTHYEGKNNYRMPAYHRMDVGFNYRKEKKRGNAIWNVSLYNAYNRRNPFYMFEDYEYSIAPNTQGHKVLKIISLFPVIPSVSYSFSF